MCGADGDGEAQDARIPCPRLSLSKKAFMVGKSAEEFCVDFDPPFFGIRQKPT